MDERSLFIKFWEHEAKTTHTVLSRIPEGSTYKPDPKSRTAAEIAWQIVCEEKMIIEALESGTMAWNPEPQPKTMKEAGGRLPPAEHGHHPSLEGAAGLGLGWPAPVLRPRAPGLADGLELPLRHRPSPRADHARTCGRWDRRCRRSTGRAATSRNVRSRHWPMTPLQVHARAGARGSCERTSRFGGCSCSADRFSGPQCEAP